MRRSLPILFSVVFMDMLSVGLVIPLMPFWAQRFGAGPALIGLLLAAYPLGQVFGAPAVGRLSDRFGRKPMLLLSVGGTFASLLLLGFARSLPWLFAARFLDGLTGGNITVAQAYIADSTGPADRAKSLGLVGAAFGLGFIFGPPAGGLLATAGLSVPAFAAAGVAALNLFAIAFALPESLGDGRRAELAARPRTAFSLALLLEALRDPKIGVLLRVRVAASTGFTVFETVFALWAAAALGLGPASVGIVLAYVGVLVAALQGGGIGPLVARFSEGPLLKASLWIGVAGLGAWALSPSVPVLLLALVPLAFGNGVSNVAIRSLVVQASDADEVGGTLGLLASLESVVRVGAPALGGALLATGTWAPGLFALSAVALAGLFAARLVGPGAANGPAGSELAADGART